ncbi:MAG: hypothetical protein K6F05_06385 [Succinivibrio sp.]|nr:hypothetical protein [Succinivibrio sp.]
MSLETFGLCCGFFAAFCQALNYTFSKDCQEKYNLHGIRELVAVHICMFVLCIGPFLYYQPWQYLNLHTALLLLCNVSSYLVAQYIMILVFDRQDASIVSPLMTIKTPILALIAFLFFDKEFTPLQYTAIFAIIALGFYFSSLSGRVKPTILLVLALVCVCFSISDLSMTALTYAVPGETLTVVAICSVCEYVVCGLIALPLMPLCKVPLMGAYHAKWVGITWLVCTLAFVVTFHVNGVVEGNIIQTLRSVIGVIIAYVFYRRYIKDESTFKKKMLITLGMFTAVVLYYL